MYKYHDFDLVIKPIDASQHRYRAQVLDSSVRQGEAEFTMSVPQDQIDRLPYQQESEIKRFGSQLYEMLFGEGLRSLLQGSLSAARQQPDTGLRVRLHLTDTPELAVLPWEYLYNPNPGEDFLFMTVETSLVRYIDLPARPPLSIGLPLNLLVMIPMASDLPLLDVNREWSNLNKAMDKHVASGKVIIELLEPASLAQLQERLRQAEYHILHFIGHGAFDEKRQNSQLMLEDETGSSSKGVDARQLGKLLYDERTLRLVVLNTCEAGRASPTNYFAGAAQSLVKSGVPAVIAMQSIISDRAAIAFSRDFYGALADGYPVDAAMAEGRKAIFTRESVTEWGIPTLYSRVRDGQLLDIDLVTSDKLATRSGQPTQPQIWFVSATSKRNAWDEAFKDGQVDWTGVNENEARQNIRATRNGDLVIAYRSVPDKYITGLGHVAGEPFEITAEKVTRPAVKIVMDLNLEQGVNLDELRAAVPDLQHVQRSTPLGWSPVTPEQWAVIRELMRFHNPGVDDKLPAAMAPPMRRIEAEPPEFSGSKVASEGAQVRFRLHSRSNTTWLGDEQIRIIGIWQPLEPNAPPDTWDWVKPLSDAVPPGGVVEFSGLEGKLPNEAGERQIDWTLDGVGWQPSAEPVKLSSHLMVEPIKTAQPPQRMLSGLQENQLQEALLDAFDQSELTEMVRQEIGENLIDIAFGNTLAEFVFNLIEWAQRHGRVGDLVRSAQAQRPNSRAFAALAAELGGKPPAATPAPGITIGKIEAANVGEKQVIDQRDATFHIVGGVVNTDVGDFVGRDKVVHGDSVYGNKITVGDVTGADAAEAPPAEIGVKTLPAEPPMEAPLAELGVETPPAQPDTEAPLGESGVETPPVQPETEVPPAEPGVETPPAQPETEAAPGEPGIQTPSALPATESPPAEAGIETRPAQPVTETPPAKFETDTAFTEAGVETTPAEPGAETPSTQPVTETPSAELEIEGPPAKPGVETSAVGAATITGATVGPDSAEGAAIQGESPYDGAYKEQATEQGPELSATRPETEVSSTRSPEPPTGALVPPADPTQLSVGTTVPVHPGATTINREPPPPPELPPHLNEAQKTAANVIYNNVWNNVWQNFVQSVERPQDSFAVRTLDINIQPRADDQVKEALSLIAPGQTQVGGQPRRYWVVMTLQERTNGQFSAPRYFEGPLNLEAFQSEYERIERGDGRYGQFLFNALFSAKGIGEGERRATIGHPGKAPSLLAGYIDALAGGNNVPLRIQVRIDSKAVELHNYQWEYLWDIESGRIGGSVACSDLAPFSRVLQVSGPGGQRPPHIDQNRPLRVLAAMASPLELTPDWALARTPETVGLQPIERAEIEALVKVVSRLKLIEKLEGNNLFDGRNGAVTLEALEKRLLAASLEEDRPFHALHLLCHGFVGADNKSYVVLERGDGGQAAVVPEDQFADRIGYFVDPPDRHGQRQPGLRLIILASCFTARPTQGSALGGVARRLVEAGVPAVVAMQHDFQYEAAQYFSQRLYAHLVYHGEIDRAVNAARRELWVHRRLGPRDRENNLRPDEWGVPVLFMRLADGRLFTVDEQNPQLVDLKAAAEITRYEDTDSGDPQRLMQTTMRAVASQMGVNAGLDTMALARSIGEAIVAATASAKPSAEPIAPAVRLFGEDSERRQRWALIKAANDHRSDKSRRTVLFLRSLARRRIAYLIDRTRIDELDENQFRTEIWEGGSAALDVWRTSAGPAGFGLDGTKADEKALPFVPLAWRDAQRQSLLVVPAPPPIFQGNLVWSDDTRPYPLGLVDIVAIRHAARQLLFGSNVDPYANRLKAFENLMSLNAHPGQEVFGLGEQIASLLLHVVAPEDFVPYQRPLAEKILKTMWPMGSLAYDSGFEKYCKLAKDLLSDDELGFENLADVAYFLQRLDAALIPWEPADNYPPDYLPVLTEPVALDPSRFDSALVIRKSLMEQASAALNFGKHMILTGPPGTGKTTTAEDICRHARDLGHCRGHILVTATADWTTFDTIGGLMPGADGTLAFRPGIFLEAIRSGKWLVIDEINRADIDKSFGELFTVLSGQAVTLPYTLNGRPVRILPAGTPASDSPTDYVIHRNWRIIGTMNVYDKASLFAMSYAFMRRFAFVEVAIPDAKDYKQLLETSLGESIAGSSPAFNKLLLDIFDSSEEAKNPLMRWRALGPAFARDLIGYLSKRVAPSSNLEKLHLAEALSLYVVPQFDGLERDNILAIYGQLNEIFKEDTGGGELMSRIRELFPYVSNDDWPVGPGPTAS